MWSWSCSRHDGRRPCLVLTCSLELSFCIPLYVHVTFALIGEGAFRQFGFFQNVSFHCFWCIVYIFPFWFLILSRLSYPQFLLPFHFFFSALFRAHSLPSQMFKMNVDTGPWYPKCFCRYPWGAEWALCLCGIRWETESGNNAEQMRWTASTELRGHGLLILDARRTCSSVWRSWTDVQNTSTKLVKCHQVKAS